MVDVSCPSPRLFTQLWIRFQRKCTCQQQVHRPGDGSSHAVWYALTLLLTMVEGAIYWHTSGRLPIWIVASSVLWMLVIVCTVTILVPINNRIASWRRPRRLPIGSVTGADGICFTAGALSCSRQLSCCSSWAFCNQRSCGHDASADQSNHKEDNPMSEVATRTLHCLPMILARAGICPVRQSNCTAYGLVGNTYTITVAVKIPTAASA